MIGLVKKCLMQVLNQKRCSYGELATILAEAAQMVNSRPIEVLTEDPYSGTPLTPLHLLIGRSSIEVPHVRFDENASVPKRLQFIEELKSDFWEKWIAMVFGERVHQDRWRKLKRDPMVGDVVLMKEETAASLRYHRGRISAVRPGADGHARSVEVTYKNPTEAVFRKSWRPIQKLVLLVPADYDEENRRIRAGEDEDFSANLPRFIDRRRPRIAPSRDQ
jgi:hypothetical protein